MTARTQADSVFIPWDKAALAGCRAANPAACLTPYRNRAHMACKGSVGEQDACGTTARWSPHRTRGNRNVLNGPCPGTATCSPHPRSRWFAGW
jgi:hypothetical protein